MLVRKDIVMKSKKVVIISSLILFIFGFLLIVLGYCFNKMCLNPLMVELIKVALLLSEFPDPNIIL